MSQISFDRETAARLEAAYVTRDILRRRELVYEALQPEPGQRILDVGCGPGFYVAELLDRVGSSGAVTGHRPERGNAHRHEPALRRALEPGTEGGRRHRASR